MVDTDIVKCDVGGDQEQDQGSSVIHHSPTLGSFHTW